MQYLLFTFVDQATLYEAAKALFCCTGVPVHILEGQGKIVQSFGDLPPCCSRQCKLRDGTQHRSRTCSRLWRNIHIHMCTRSCAHGLPSCDQGHAIWFCPDWPIPNLQHGRRRQHPGRNLPRSGKGQSTRPACLSPICKSPGRQRVVAERKQAKITPAV